MIVTDTNAALAGRADEALLGNYRRAPIAFTHGEGCRLWDVEGNSYLDFTGGVAVSSLGHAHPALVRAISQQAQRYLHVSNLYQLPEQIEAAERLLRLTGLSKAFFCNSGTEANEAAIKLARKHLFPRFRILVAENGFHGRTMGSLAATGNPAYHEGFQPLPQGFTMCPYNDLSGWEFTEDVCAVLVEPIQGEGGVVPGRADFLKGLQDRCREHGALLMLDEVQTGIGRCGSMFAYQKLGLDPDVVTLAKGLGGGVPVGAMLSRYDALKPGQHGCTFGGNALSCAALNAVVPEVEKLLGHVEQVGAALRASLQQLPHVTEVRGEGLLIGVDLDIEARPVEEACRARGLLVNSVRAQTLRLAPPLVVSIEEVERVVKILRSTLDQIDPPS